MLLYSLSWSLYYISSPFQSYIGKGKIFQYKHLHPSAPLPHFVNELKILASPPCALENEKAITVDNFFHELSALQLSITPCRCSYIHYYLIYLCNSLSFIILYLMKYNIISILVCFALMSIHLDFQNSTSHMLFLMIGSANFIGAVQLHPLAGQMEHFRRHAEYFVNRVQCCFTLMFFSIYFFCFIAYRDIVLTITTYLGTQKCI